MFRAPRLSRPKRSIVATIVITVALALPAGVVLASHQFGDVPNSNPFHGDIDALVDSGITAGCGSGNYCPKANVTREQMAAFMNRLGALAPGKTPVVNAATALSANNANTLDGIDSSAFHRYNAAAPASSTQYGAWALATPSDAFAGETEVSFPVPLSTVPNVQFVQHGGSATAQCPGSAASPSAAAGFLCIYVGWNADAFSTPGSEPVSVYDPVDGGGGASRFGAVLYIWDEGDADAFAEASGTWAVTAPLSGFAPDDSSGEDSTRGAAR